MMRRRPVLISAVAANPAVSGVALPFTLIENCCNSMRAGSRSDTHAFLRIARAPILHVQQAKPLPHHHKLCGHTDSIRRISFRVRVPSL